MAQDYLSIKNVLSLFAANHDEIKRFSISAKDDELNNFSTAEASFPLLYGVPQDISYGEHEHTYNYRIYCIDLLQKDRSNEDTVMNSASAILADLTNWLRLNYEAPVRMINSPRAFPVSDFLMDGTAGFYADFEFETNGITSDCYIPFSSEPQLTGATCDISYQRPWLTCANLTACTYYIDLVNNSIVTTELNAGLILSGGTDLYDIFLPAGTTTSPTRVQPGLNIYTGGTANAPTINISAATLTSLESALITSGGTDLYDIFLSTDTNDITRVQPGSNISTGGTSNAPTVNVVASPSFNNLTVSGTTLLSGNTTVYGNAFSSVNGGVTNFSRGWIYSDSGQGSVGYGGNYLQTSATDIGVHYNSVRVLGITAGSLVFGNILSTSFGINLTTGSMIFVSADGAGIRYNADYSAGYVSRSLVDKAYVDARLATKASLSAATFTSLSASTIYSGSTNLYSIFSTTDTNTITNVQGGSNITTGGTSTSPTINVVASPAFNSGSFSGNVSIGTASTANQRALRVGQETSYVDIGSWGGGGSAAAIYMNQATPATTNFTMAGDGSSTFLNAPTASGVVRMGILQTYIATFNSTGLTIGNTSVVQSTARLDIISASTAIAQLRLRSGSTVTTPNDGDMWYDGTNLVGKFGGSSKILGDVVRVQPGSNISTGGTANAPTINVVASPAFNNLTASGTTNLSIVQSGGTNLYSIFSTTDTNTITNVQGGSNITTGGTSTAPTINLASVVSVNTISVSGNVYNTGQYWSGGSSFDTVLGRFTKNASSSGNSVMVLDSRSVDETPTGRSVGMYFDFKQNSTDGLTDGGNYHSIMHYRGYGTVADLSGGNPHQLGLTQNNNMYMRTGTGTTGWTVWKKFLMSGETNILPTNQIAFGSSASGVTGTTTFTHTNGLLTLGNTASEGNYLRVVGSSATSSTTYDGLKIERYFPRITMSDTATGGSSFQIWSLGNGLRFGTAAGSTATAAMMLWSGNSGNSMFLGNMVIGGGSVSWEADTKLHVKGNAKVTQSLSAATYFSGSTNLYNIFSTTDTNTITNVQGGSNITTGGTATAPTVNVVASPSFNNLTASGTTNLSVIQSGGTGLYQIFSAATVTTGHVLIGTGSNQYSGNTALRFTQQELIIDGGLRPKIRANAVPNYAIAIDDFTVFTDVDVDLPPAISTNLGKWYAIKNTSAGGDVRITPNGIDTIEGLPSFTLKTAPGTYSSVMLSHNGADWKIMASHVNP